LPEAYLGGGCAFIRKKFLIAADLLRFGLLAHFPFITA